MKTKFLTSILAALVVVALSGCSKPAANVQALDPATLPATVNQAFEKAPDDTKQQATSYVTAFQGQDAPAAFTQLRQLSAQKNLSVEQRAVLAKAMRTTFQQLQASAQNGDAAAKAAMHQYLSSR
jgi:hypothetical protein